MNIKLTNTGDPKKNRVVEVRPIEILIPGGGNRFSLIGFENDGTVWIQPKELGIVPEQAEVLMDFPKPWLIVDEFHGLVFLHWRAAAKLLEPGERREKWEQFTVQIFKQYQRLRAYESSRNN
jgi:hypothetical protein